MLQDLICNVPYLDLVDPLPVRSGFQFHSHLISHIPETAQQFLAESTAFPVQNHLHGFFMGKCLLIRPFTGQRVIHIRQRHNLRRYGDLLSPQPVRIASAVIPLMMPAADLPCRLHQCFILIKGNLLQHGISHC